jgi:hypothetical protein
MNKTSLFLLTIFLFISPVFASNAEPWLRHPDISDVSETKSGTIMTFYWTFDPDNADEGWDEWSRDEWSEDMVDLKGTDIIVTRNMAEKFNLEGSGWYTDDGDNRVINIIEPDADPENTLFKEVAFVDYGLDAPHYHFGLVPFRTVAAVHSDIPAGTWVYIPMFDGLELNVYDLDDRAEIDYTFWHDGWFRVTDISWSFADDASQIDVFTGTVQATAELYDQIKDEFEQKDFWNDTKEEDQTLDSYQDDISFFYRADVPVYSTEASSAAFRYAITTDTVNNDTKAQEFNFATGISEPLEVINADIDGDGYRDDAVIYFEDSKALKGYLDGSTTIITSSTTPEWQIDLSDKTVNDIAVGDYSNSGVDGVILATTGGIFGAPSLTGTVSLEELSSEVASIIALGDIENDDDNELVILSGSTLKSAKFKSGSYGSFSDISTDISGDISAICLGDITAEGQDELIIGTSQGIYSYNFTGSFTGLFADDITSPADLHTAYVDPDGFADVYAVHDGNVKAKYSSHKVGSPFVTLGSTNNSWVSVATIDPRIIGKDSPVSVSTPHLVKNGANFSVKRGSISLPASTKAGSLSIYTLTGRRVATVHSIKEGSSLVYSLTGLNVSNQPLLFSLVVGGTKISKVLLIK